jgi:hypothetical protein
MSLLQVNRQPPVRVLRQFALLWLPLFCAVLGYLVYVRAGAVPAVGALWGAGLASLTVGAVRPQAMRPLFVGWMLAVWPIGFLVSHCILAVVFYLVVTPIGLVLRLAGRDPLTRRFEPGAGSYWTEHNPDATVDRYFRQY